MSIYDGFTELNDMARLQKEYVLEGGTGGYEPHSHSLYKTMLPEFRERYGVNRARDMLSILAYLHASKAGDTSPLSIPIELRGWAMVRNDTIERELGMGNRTVTNALKALQEERLLIVKKAPYQGNIKNYFLPLYYPLDVRGAD